MTTTAYQDTYANDNLPPRTLWPELIFDETLPAYPARINCAVELLDTMVAAGRGDAPAIHGAHGSWSYAMLQAQVSRIAHVLREDLGLRTGNRVLVRGANNAMMAASILAIWKAGLIAVPTMPLLRAKELHTILDLAEVNAVLCAGALKQEMVLGIAQAARPPAVLYFDDDGPASLEALMATRPGNYTAVDTAAEDVCIIGFTSGTTGRPKGTMHFHRDVMAICDCFPRSTLKVQADDVFIGTPPLAFTFGLGGLLLFPMRFGAATVLMEKLSPDLLLKAITDYRVTICVTAPTFYRQMAPLAVNHDLGSLRKSVSAGEALSLETRQRSQEATGLAMIDGIGATEMLHIFISAADDQIRPGATGKPIPGYTACVLDAAGRQVGPGVPGRLAVKGPTGCRYLADPRQREYVVNGWNVTGDTYEMDHDGYFWYRARTDDMIISAGYNIAGPEVEEGLMQHPDVAECAVVACPDEERGQVVMAYVVLKQGIAPSAEMAKTLQDFIKQNIAPYKYPRKIEFRTRLPRTETGKLQRFKLRLEAQGQ
ncbi:AMP-binding protein [Duganella phyllosphaerae]|nr:AMP-binding protein [Duganella phyllosphaerae]